MGQQYNQQQQQQQQYNTTKQKRSSSSSSSNKYQNHQQYSNGYHSSSNHHTNLYFGDIVQLSNKKKGTVTALGPRQDKEGVWIRINMENNVDTTSVWVPRARVSKIISSSKRKYDLTIGDRVIETRKKIAGIIRYVGPMYSKQSQGIMFGVEYDVPKG